MNHDEQNPDLQTWIEPELEARLVAVALGEASAFEQAELERLIGEKPELGIFKRRIEAVHGLVGAAVRPETEPLQLSAERRAKVLQAIGPLPAGTKRGSRDAHILQEIAAARRERRRKRWWSYSIAGSLAAAALLMLMAVPTFQKVSSRRFAKDDAPTVALMARDDAPMPLEMPKIETESDGVFANGATLSAPMSRARGMEVPPDVRAFASGAGNLSYYSNPTAPQGTGQVVYGAIKSPAPAGFQVPNTMAGVRFKTELKDVRSAISVVTRQLAQDVGATSNANLLNYTANTGAGGAQGNFSAPAGVVRNEKDLPSDYSEPDDNVVVLSPFEVSATNDTGYQATSTLAGTRIKTNLDDWADKRLATGAPVFDTNGKSATPPPAFDQNDGFLSGAGAVSEGGKRPNRPDPSQTSITAAMDDDRPRQPRRPAPDIALGQGADLTREIATADESISTFSLHVSDVSYKLAQAALARGDQPDPETIRPEEFYNAFDYGDPAPATTEKIACRIEQAAHPLLQQRNLVRIAMRVPTVGRGAAEPLRLTVLLDTSGSMEREDRMQSVQRAFQVLATLLGPNDRVTLIGFARQPRLLAEDVPGNEAAKLGELAAHTPYTGGTNLEEGLKLAAELAKRHRADGAQNRIVLLTDGAANLGSSDPARLAQMIEQQRQQGIAFDACGVGTDGLDDAILEALTRKGDGRYYVLDRPEDADAGFAQKLAGAFRPAAENVKVQVRFNPARVGHYRLIGFEQHRLKTEDFRNDKVDAAELAAGEAAVALYQVEVLPQGEGELGDVYVRFRDPATRTMVERSWTILHEPHPPAFDRASPTLQLAGTAALVAEKLRGGEFAKTINLADLEPVVNALRGRYASDVRVQEFLEMFEKVRRKSE